MFVKCTVLKDGPGPSELIASVTMSDGNSEEIILSAEDITHGYMQVGNPLSVRDKEYLIELPRESASGRWRVWVPESQVKRDSLAIAAE